MRARFAYSRALRALVRHPVLLWEAIRTSLAMRRRGGVRPASPYLEWRLHTAYGGQVADAPTADLVDFLRWRRSMRSIVRQEMTA